MSKNGREQSKVGPPLLRQTEKRQRLHDGLVVGLLEEEWKVVRHP